MKVVLIPAGEFSMGSGESAEESAAFFNKFFGTHVFTPAMYTDEHPQHRVRITRPFYLGAHNVTRGQFRKFVADTNYRTDAERGVGLKGAEGWDSEKKSLRRDENWSWRNAGFAQTDNHPVVNVSWNDAMEFCRWLSRRDRSVYRLPTEAEWEYSCRAGTTTRYSCGDDPNKLVEVANVADATAKANVPGLGGALGVSDGFAFTSPVGSFRPNRFGVYDMHGNAWQWCSDRYGPRFYATSSVNDPDGPDSGGARVYRGGSWLDGASYVRSASRGHNSPDYRSNMTSFRVVKDGG